MQLGRATTPRLNPLCCMVMDDKHDVRYVQTMMESQVQSHSTLKAKYQSLSQLWNHVLTAKVSKSGDSFAAITEDNWAICVDLNRGQTLVYQLPMASGLLLYTVGIERNIVVIGGMYG